jgi:hypothetical protein
MKHLRLLLLVAVLAPLLPAVLVAAAERVEVIKATELRAEPAATTASRGWVRKGEQGDQLGRRGGWVRVQMAERQGWLRVWQVRPADNDDGNVLLRGLERFSRSIAGLFGAGGDDTVESNAVTATIGVRGLDAGEFTSAAPNPAALQRVRGLRASADDAAAFARAAGLRQRQLSTPQDQPTQDWEDW